MAVADARDAKAELALLGQLDLFAQFELAELVRIRGASSSISFDDGEYVTRIGEVGDALYVLVTGKAVVTAQEEVLTTLQTGAHVGEMAMVDAQPRSASVISMGESRWLRVARGYLPYRPTASGASGQTALEPGPGLVGSPPPHERVSAEPGRANA